MQELVIKEVIHIQLIPTILKATYQTSRKLQLETRSLEETHLNLEELVVMGPDNLQLEQQARTKLDISNSTHRLPRI